MLKKITTGFVIQDYDPSIGDFVSQEFIASDEVVWENEKGDKVEGPKDNPYLHFNMEQPS